MSLANLKNAALATWTNMRGWRTRRKLVVFESDDWGAVRMPGPEAWQKLLNVGIRVDRSRYDSLDCLETRDDFEQLMNVLARHHDSRGRAATFTFNTVMGNPDFAAIESDGFERFHHQHLFDSYGHYHGQNLEQDWQRAIGEGLVRPQFHAREHLNSRLWMSDLRAGQKETRLAFEHGFYGLKTRTGSKNQKNYLAACWAESDQEVDDIERIMADGLQQFERTFGFASRSFIACNYAWPRVLEERLVKHGIELLQGQRGQVAPQPEKGGQATVRRHYTGEQNAHGQCYSVRNVLFEPYLDENTDWAKRALAEIKQAFVLNRPAIVCTHRINYVSGMDLAHRDRSLRQLDSLLAQISKRWPDVEFTTSDELSELMRPKKQGPRSKKWSV